MVERIQQEVYELFIREIRRFKNAISGEKTSLRIDVGDISNGSGLTI